MKTLVPCRSGMLTNRDELNATSHWQHASTLEFATYKGVPKEEGFMGIIMINCPSTGRAVSTEIEVYDVDRLPTVVATIECPVCGCVHQWTKNDAWLARGGEYYRKVAADRAAESCVNEGGADIAAITIAGTH